MYRGGNFFFTKIVKDKPTKRKCITNFEYPVLRGDKTEGDIEINIIYRNAAEQKSILLISRQNDKMTNFKVEVLVIPLSYPSVTKLTYPFGSKIT